MIKMRVVTLIEKQLKELEQVIKILKIRAKVRVQIQELRMQLRELGGRSKKKKRISSSL